MAQSLQTTVGGTANRFDPSAKPYYGNTELSDLFAAQQRGESISEQQDVEALEYVDVIHNGVALMTRPLAVDLVKVMSKPDAAMSRPMSLHTPPNRYAPKNASSSKKEKILVQPLSSSRVIGVMPSLMGMQIWFAGYGMPLKPSKIDLEEFPFRKALVLGFDTMWYVLPLRELTTVSLANFAAPQRIYRAYKTRENAMKAAKDYIATGKLTKRCVVPPELLEIYRTAKPQHQENAAYWAKCRRLQNEAGVKIPNPSLNQPPEPTHWHF